MYGWIQYAIKCLQPFAVVDNLNHCDRLRYGSIALSTFHKYPPLLIERVEKNISTVLPSCFALICDGQSSREARYAAVFVSFTSPRPASFSTVCLALSPMEDVTTQIGDENVTFFKFVLAHLEAFLVLRR